MKIIVIGATGMVGSRVVAEAAQRAHEVVAASRSGREVAGASSALKVDLHDTQETVAVIDAADAAVLAVPGSRDGHDDEIIPVHRALIATPPTKRMLIVGGAGSLFVPGTETRLKDAEGFPAEYKAEADAFTTVLEDYEASNGVDWTIISPAPVLAPGERTGSYQSGKDNPLGDTISAEDLAVAIVDELENPKHRGERFTASN